MIVWIVTGYNGLLNAFGVVGVADSEEKAKKILIEQEYMLDKSNIMIILAQPN